MCLLIVSVKFLYRNNLIYRNFLINYCFTIKREFVICSMHDRCVSLFIENNCAACGRGSRQNIKLGFQCYRARVCICENTVNIDLISFQIIGSDSIFSTSLSVLSHIFICRILHAIMTMRLHKHIIESLYFKYLLHWPLPILKLI